MYLLLYLIRDYRQFDTYSYAILDLLIAYGVMVVIRPDE